MENQETKKIDLTKEKNEYKATTTRTTTLCNIVPEMKKFMIWMLEFNDYR